MLGSLLGVAVGAITLASTAALASNVYIVDNTNPSCSVSGPGTPAQPFCTIAGAANVALPGDTVLVQAGTYAGTSVNPRNSGVTFTANPGVTISGGTRAFAISARSNIVISGFIITGTSSYGISVSGSSSNVTISGNTESFAGTPISSPAMGIYLSNLAGGLVQGNVTHDNSAHGIYLTGTTTGVTVQGNTSYHNAYQYQRNANGIDDIAPGNSIIGNVTYANEDTGINIYSGGNNALVTDNVTYGNGDHGIDDFNVTGGRIIGNTVYGNCTDGINVEGTSGNYNIENNVSMNNATGAIINPTPIPVNPSTGLPYYTNLCNRRIGNIGVYDSAPLTTTADYNLVYQSSSKSTEYTWAGTAYSTQGALNAATGQEAHGKFADPKFVNAAGSNFRLTEGSPGIDSADAHASGEQALDVLGNARVDDPAVANTGKPAGWFYDRGAYEFLPSDTPAGPTAALSVSPSSGTAPVTVSADASGSSAGSSPISTYSFAWGDGNSTGQQAGATAGHTYSSAGSYPVTVTVTDGNGLTSQASQTVTVSSQQQTGPTAALSVSPSSGTAPVTVSADASGSSAGSSPISTYSFAWGDGNSTGQQAGATAGHTYSSAGSYPVTVTVTDGNGLTSQASQTVTVSAQQQGSNARYINQIATNYSTTSHTSGSVTVWRTGGVGAGNLIVATVQLTGTSATGAVSGTDSKGDTLSVASDVSDGSGDRLLTLSGIAGSGLAINDQVIISFPTASSYRIAADEVSGVSSQDKEAVASGTSGTFSSGSTGTISQSGEFVFSAVATFGGTSIGWNAGWTPTTTYTVGTNALGRAYQIPASVGQFAGSGTASGTWLATTVTFM